MKAIIAGLLALLFGIHADTEKAKADASCCVAYAVVAKEEKKPEPKPEPKPDGGAKPKEKPESNGICECDKECPGDGKCQCPDCKKDGSCCQCGLKWTWKQTGELTGEYQKAHGDKVWAARKYVRKRIEQKVCDGRSCRIVVVGHTDWTEK